MKTGKIFQKFSSNSILRCLSPFPFLGGLFLEYNLKTLRTTGFDVGTDSCCNVTPMENTRPFFTNDKSKTD